MFQVDIQVSPQNPPGKSKSTPVWVIIVAVLGGVLLLALAILALFKVIGRASFFNTIRMDLFHNDVKRRKRDVRRNLIGLKRTLIIAEPIKFRVSSWKPHLTSL